jgi:glycosyltransferase involved in cell wall biosynthesis
MRVAIVAPFHNRGGSEQQILLLLKGLHEKGIEVLLFHLDVRSPDLIDSLEAIPNCHHIQIRFRSIKNPVYFFLDVVRLARQLRRFRCDIVNCWNYTGHLIGGPASRLAGIPCAFSIRGLDLWKKDWQLPFYRLLNQLPDLFIFQAANERDIVSRREWIPEKKSSIIPNGLDRSRFSIPEPAEVRLKMRSKLGLSHTKPLVLSVGSLRAIKGHDVLIEAVCRLSEREPGLGFHVVIVGDGPLREAYEVAADGLPISFAGFHRDVEEFYYAADLYCQPSRSEGLPNAVIEAITCGLPVVASDVGGLGELVTHANGILCEPEDPDALAQSLADLLTHPEVWGALKDASLEMSERFSSEAMVESYIDVYRSVLAGDS